MDSDTQITLNKFSFDMKNFWHLMNDHQKVSIPTGGAIAFLSPYGLSFDSKRSVTEFFERQSLVSVSKKNALLKSDTAKAKQGLHYYQNHYARIANPLNFVEGVTTAVGYTLARTIDRLLSPGKDKNVKKAESNILVGALKVAVTGPFQLVRYALKVVNFPINLALDQIDRGVRGLMEWRDNKKKVREQETLSQQEQQPLLQEGDSPENTDDLSSTTKNSRESEETLEWKKNQTPPKKIEVKTGSEASSPARRHSFDEYKQQNKTAKTRSDPADPKPTPDSRRKSL